MRVLVVGVDGANIDLIKSWAAEGKLPAFKRLLAEGSSGHLESVTPTISIPAWNCLTTGKNPGKIGCFSFIQKVYRGYEFWIYSSQVGKERNVWDILSDAGYKVFVFNPINVQIAYKLNGEMVAGCLAPLEEKMTFPADLRRKLDGLGYKPDIGDFKTLMTLSDKEFSERNKELTEIYFDILFNYLEEDWDFGFFVINELDRIQHRYWDQKDLLLEHYQNIDKELEKLLHKLDNRNDEIKVIIVADHGFGPNKRIFLVNEWLASKGLLEVKKAPILGTLATLFRIIKLPAVLKLLRPLHKRSYLIRYLHFMLFQSTGKTAMIWSKTKAFSYATFGTIYLNLKNREPEGIVEEAEYESLRSDIIEGLRELSVKAYRAEDLYQGEYMKLSPDIVIETDDTVTSVSSRVGFDKYFLDGVGGSHDKLNGTFIAWGPGIKGNNELNAKMYDVTPTILHIFGTPVPKDMDGRVLKEIFEGELAAREIKYRDLEGRKDKRIVKRIKELKHRGKI